jgi:RNA-directed DNA polymerase
MVDIKQFSRKHKTILQEIARCYFSLLLQENQKHKVNAAALLSLEMPAELCRFLKTSIPQLETMINSPVYEHYTVKKKRGGERHIFAPEKQLKKIQKRLNYFLQAYYLWIKPPEVHGFVINPHYLGAHCNIVENAKPHIGKKHILNIDLKDFFSTISAKRIKKLFTSSFFKYNEQMAVALALLTTYKAKLPTGAPTSPVLSNFVCFELDAELQFYCSFNGLQFTRYADDLTFSSNSYISQDIIQHIIQIINESGFEINQKKLRLQSSNRKQTVTGLTVNEKVNVDRKLLKKIRAMVHDLTTNGIDVATQRHCRDVACRVSACHVSTCRVSAEYRRRFIYRLEGYINFVGQVRGKTDGVYRKLKEPFDDFFKRLE